MSVILKEKIALLYAMQNESPKKIYQDIFNMSNITIRNKISIIASCLNDQKAIDNNEDDPKDRKRALKKAAQSLEQLIAKRAIICL